MKALTLILVLMPGLVVAQGSYCAPGQVCQPGGAPRYAPGPRSDVAPALPRGFTPPAYPEAVDPELERIRRSALGQQQTSPPPQTLAPMVPIAKPPPAIDPQVGNRLQTVEQGLSGIIKKLDALTAEKEPEEDDSSTCRGSGCSSGNCGQTVCGPTAATDSLCGASPCQPTRPQLSMSWLSTLLDGDTARLLMTALGAAGATAGVPWCWRAIGAYLLRRAAKRLTQHAAANSSLVIEPPAGEVRTTVHRLQRVPTTDHEFEKLKEAIARVIAYDPSYAPVGEMIYSAFGQLMSGVSGNVKKLRASSPPKGATMGWNDD